MATGAILLFTDADTRHDPELIPRCVSALKDEGVDLVSVVPRQEMVTFWERVVQPHIFLVLASRVGGLERINRTRVEWNGIANGQFILTTRAAYQTVGTHEAVKDRVVEDLALAQAYVRHGLNIFLVHGPQYMVTRMYRSLADVVEGWSKNLALGVPFTLPPIPWVRRMAPYLMWTPVARRGSDRRCGGRCVVATGRSPPLSSRSRFGRSFIGPKARRCATRCSIRSVPAVVVGIMVRSAWRGGRKIVWRGRQYGTG